MNMEWEHLRADMVRAGEFYGPRLSPHFLARNFFDGRAVLRVRSTLMRRMHYCAYIAWLETKNSDYDEVALAYVSPDLEGKGVLREIMADLMKRIPDGRKLLGVSKKTAMKKTFVRHGFRLVTPVVALEFGITDIEDWWRSVAPGREFPAATLRPDGDHLIEGERQLFIRA